MNDLPSKEWVRRTKSVWVSLETLTEVEDMTNAMERGVLNSTPNQRDKLKVLHPASFSEEDAGKLIEFFTKQGETVLDPFIGVGSTAVACVRLDRRCVGIELYEKWLDIARARLGLFQEGITLHQGDALTVLKTMQEASIDFVITSPPYWNILNKVDRKAQTERVRKGLKTNYGRLPEDYSLIEDYATFLNQMGQVFAELYRVVKPKRYACVIVSDFRHQSRYYLFHADIAAELEKAGFIMHGMIIIVQDKKTLYPYGYPHTFVPNICNQFALIAYKASAGSAARESQRPLEVE